LADVPDFRLIVQPSNRETLAAILFGLIKIFQADPDAVIAFFPSNHYYSDHYYSREAVLVQGISGLQRPRRFATPWCCWGAKALSPETGYGYIAPGTQLAVGNGK
jgi:mannose-1-phosphate guanylyltransferase